MKVKQLIDKLKCYREDLEVKIYIGGLLTEDIVKVKTDVDELVIFPKHIRENKLTEVK